MNEESIKQVIESVRTHYEEQGIFMRKFGYGKSPALLIIDMAYGWTAPEYATGSRRLDETIVMIEYWRFRSALLHSISNIRSSQSSA